MIRIAVADDEQLARYNLSSMLRETFADIEIIEAENGQELVHLVQEKQVDIALVDIRMPRMDGLEAMERCKNRETIPWAIVSSYAEFPYAKRAIALGAQGYILKPPDPAEVREITLGLIKKFDEIQKEKIEQLNIRWNQLLQNMDASIISDTDDGEKITEKDYLKESEGVLPAIISVQGLAFPQGSIGQLIRNNCGNSLEKRLVLIHSNPEQGFYEIVCSVARTVDSSTWKGNIGNHLLARLQHDFSLYQIKIIFGTPCPSLETAKTQIFKMRELLHFEPLLPNTCLALEEASQLLLPCTSVELEAARSMVALIRSWHRKDWVACKNLILDVHMILGKVEKRPQHHMILNLEKALYISPRLSQHFLRDDFLEETKQELLCAVQQKQTAVQEDPLTEILRFIDRHFTENISLSQIADLFGFSPNYLSTLFHQKTGKTYTSYITTLRMKEARNLLRSGISVKETAWAVGYADEQHFAGLYKKIMGMAPGLEKKSSF
uniref:Response regulator n=1 Tax=Gracilinema caldarium TaxID=215591 RepID=A0A7C3I5V6_9SPIR